MGGSGSGRLYGWGSKSTTESQHRIDIRWLKKQKYLRPGASGSLSWSRRGENTGSIGFKMEENTMVLNYRHKSSGGEWEDVEQVINHHQRWGLDVNRSKRLLFSPNQTSSFADHAAYQLPRAS